MKTPSLKQFSSKLKAHLLWGGAFLILNLVACQGYEKQDLGNVALSGQEDMVFGGEKVEAEDPLAQYLVGLKFEDKNGQWQTCTGSWIAEEWILTAAHCLPENLNQLRVFQKRSLVDFEPTMASDYKVMGMQTHPEAAEEKKRLTFLKKWDVGNRFDIALIKVENTSANHKKFDLNLKPRYPTKTPSLFVAAGYGAESYNALSGVKTGEDQLQSAILLKVPLPDEGIIYISQKDKVGICVGDSGSPLLKHKLGEDEVFELVGVASSVRNPGEAEVCFGESRYVAIEALKSWIDSVIDKSVEGQR